MTFDSQKQERRRKKHLKIVVIRLEQNFEAKGSLEVLRPSIISNFNHLFLLIFLE